LRTTLDEMVRRLKQNPAAWYRKNDLPVPDEWLVVQQQVNSKRK
jgi:hypothetical protein